MITISNLSKSFFSAEGKENVILDKLNLDISTGEIVAIVGPSGTGKSVLMKIVIGLLEADQGDISLSDATIIKDGIRGKNFAEIISKFGILFQNAALFDSLTLRENVSFPLRYQKRFVGKYSDKEINDLTDHFINEVSMTNWQNQLPGEVSIGMRKRIGIARALVTNPDVIFFDEPNTGLDPVVGQEIYDLIKKTHEKLKFTGLVISHEIPEVFQICQRAILLYKGLVQFDGNKEDFYSSQAPIIKQFRDGSTEGPIKLVV